MEEGQSRLSRRMNMEQRVVVITGVSRGLGHAMLEEFARRGHSVIGCSRSPTHVAALRDRFPAPHQFAAVDVADAGAVERWSADAIKAAGAPDLLMNNAAVINRNAPLWEIDPAEFSEVVDVNIKGVYNVIRAFVPAMIRKGKGVIVNFSSGWGRSTSPEVAPYCATKFAVEGLTQALAQELPAGLAAVPLNPGIIDTEMLRSCFGEGAGGYPTPKDWARRAVPFLLGLDARHNGRPLTVPGAGTD
jgi:NAD(P)-dependent dehydrogenase (short-subunit alcohol dehydrogenase family)